MLPVSMAAAQIMLKITGYVMKLAPLAVIFCAMASTISDQRSRYSRESTPSSWGFYFGLVCLWILLIFVGFIFLGPSVQRLILLMREPVLLAFSTASSEAAYPRLLEQLQISGRAARSPASSCRSGYSFNLDGSMMYCTFASLFIAQAYGIHLSLGTQISMLLTADDDLQGHGRRAACLAGGDRGDAQPVPHARSRAAADPRIDTFLDMGRSATNVVGNSVAAAVVAKWEGQLVTDEETASMIEEMEGSAA